MVDTQPAVRASDALNRHAACKAEVETLLASADKWTVMSLVEGDRSATTRSVAA